MAPQTSRRSPAIASEPQEAPNELPGMSAPDITEEEYEAVLAVLASGRLSIGSELDGFEAELADYFHVSHVACVNSGTSALHLGVLATGIGHNDLAITTPFSFVASANCILYEDGIPVFVDVEPETGNIDPHAVCDVASDILNERPSGRFALPPSARNLTSAALRKGLKAVLPVHVFGIPADLDPILELASRTGLIVLEDACEAIGAEYKGARVGGLGDAGVLGFYPNKQMTTGEGGAIVTNSAQWNHLFRSLRNQGRDVFNAWLGHDRLGYNYRLDEMSAAIGRVQLRRLRILLQRRAAVAKWYDDRLQSLDGITLSKVPAYATRRSWFVYTVRLDSRFDRSAVMARLAEDGVESRPYFPPIHLQPLYVSKFGFQPGSFPVSEALGECTVALPFSGIMSETQVDRICETLRSALTQLS